MKNTDVDHESDEMDVEIVKEAWSKYTLDDGSLIKVRSVLTKVVWPRRAKTILDLDGHLTVSVQNVVCVIAPNHLRGKPNPRPPSINKALVEKSRIVEIKNSKEEWSTYSLPDNKGIVKVRAVVASVRNVGGQRDQDGDPLYLVNASTEVVPELS